MADPDEDTAEYDFRSETGAPSERDIDEIPVDSPDDEGPPGEGDLDPDDDYTEGLSGDGA